MLCALRTCGAAVELVALLVVRQLRVLLQRGVAGRWEALDQHKGLAEVYRAAMAGGSRDAVHTGVGRGRCTGV